MAGIPFPELTPTRRSYSPGRLPETLFKSQNGATSFIQFGGAFVDARLELQFINLLDDDAALILVHYASITEDDHAVFGERRGLGGMSQNMLAQVERGRGGVLRWRYEDAPVVESVGPGVSSVRCSFIGYLYGS